MSSEPIKKLLPAYSARINGVVFLIIIAIITVLIYQSLDSLGLNLIISWVCVGIILWYLIPSMKNNYDLRSILYSSVKGDDNWKVYNIFIGDYSDWDEYKQKNNESIGLIRPRSDTSSLS